MYRPAHFRPGDEAAAFEAIDAWPLALLVTEGLEATHVPLLRDGDGLAGHIAKPNPHWQQTLDGAPALAVFGGPSAYVSPGFYATKAEHGRVVPTWNYVAVHVRGRLRWLHGADEKRAIVRRLTDRFEAGEAKPWSIDDAPADYVEAMLGGIVGVRLTIERIEAQFKLSQNRTEDDRSGVELGLAAREDSGSRAIARLMRRHFPFEG
ncbi:MAG: FMN-binding negative transcriptional regulator [Alphaproteobacteria bacterium]|nr:FMN-binding negative transcriptional regulator [Alphaproteobacteria bacterium]